MKNEREKEAGKERETVVEREGTAPMTRQHPLKPGKRELTAEPAAAASHFNEINENMNDDEDFFPKPKYSKKKKAREETIPLRA